MEWEDIAVRLLDKKLFLSALELYYELLEHNCEINSLRDFFSNPGNFETFYNIPQKKIICAIPEKFFLKTARSTSLQTFDSLDLVSRYSDEDPVNVADERVTVLEFELRKAQETINALRGTITTSAAPEHKARTSLQIQQQGLILPYEKRCLNFLIAEYLLENNYKLTGITLAEESGDQDVEDWEDVGLNCPRPPSLLAVYRTSDHHQMQALEQKCRGLEEKLTAMTDEMNASISQITQLKKLLAEYEENKKIASPINHREDEESVTKQSGSEDNVIVYLDRGTVRTVDERNRRQMSDCSVITQDSTDRDVCSGVGSMNSYSTSGESNKRCEVERSLADATRESPLLYHPTEMDGHVEVDAGDVDDAVDEEVDNVVDDEVEDAVDDEVNVDVDEDGVKEDKAERKRFDSERSAKVSGEDSIISATEDEQEELDEKETPAEVDNTPGSSSQSSGGKQADVDADNTDNMCDIEDDKQGEVDKDDDKQSADDAEITVVCHSPTSPEYHDEEKAEEFGLEDAKVEDSNNDSCDRIGSNEDSEQSSDKVSTEHSTEEKDESISLDTVSPFFVGYLRSLVEGTVQCRLSEEISHISDDPILVMGRCLPHIMPHVLLNKREELLPVILCLAVQHPDSSQRDNLLHLLFNLVKKPDFEQRQIIRAGCEAFAKNVDRRRLEEELLPQCWEQISDKFVERRLLVAETCGTLSAHLSADVCSSLVISILKQVLDDKDESVRESAVKNLSLVITRVHNDHKTTELLQILTAVLQDSSSKVQQTALQVYLPSISCWLISRDMYLPKCYNSLLQNLLHFVKSGSIRNTSVYLQSLCFSNVFVLASLLKPLIAEITDDLTRMSESTEESHFDLLDPHVVLNISRSQFTSLISQFNTRLAQKTLPDRVRAQVDWYTDTAVPCIIDCITNFQQKSLISEFSKFLCEMQTVLGRTFVQHVLKPGLKARVSDVRVLPVYCAGMLTATEEDRAELREFLSETLHQYSAQYLDVAPLADTFAELSHCKTVIIILVSVLNTALREAINPQIKGLVAKICKGLCDSADPQDIGLHVLPILTRLANDPDVFVQTSTIISFALLLQRCPGSLGSAREQLDKFISESVASDVHIMMCELLDSFTLVLPLCNSDIQRDFLIPRLATIGVSNTAITNKTKRRDITERLISAYKAILCSYLTPDTIEHYVLPGLQALAADAQEVVPEKQQVIELMFKEVAAKTNLSQRDSRHSNVFGSKMSGFFKKK